MTSEAPQTLTKTIIALYIQIAFNVLWFLLFGLGTIFVFFGSIIHHFRSNDLFTLVILVTTMGWLICWSIFVGIVVNQLKKQKRWAWIAALIISAMSCFSFPSIILGTISMVGLLNGDVINWFNHKTATT